MMNFWESLLQFILRQTLIINGLSNSPGLNNDLFHFVTSRYQRGVVGTIQFRATEREPVINIKLCQFWDISKKNLEFDHILMIGKPRKVEDDKKIRELFIFDVSKMKSY